MNARGGGEEGENAPAIDQAEKVVESEKDEHNQCGGYQDRLAGRRLRRF